MRISIFSKHVSISGKRTSLFVKIEYMRKSGHVCSKVDVCISVVNQEIFGWVSAV